MEWLACGKKFIEADVIRWKEPVWKPKARRPTKIGERLVTAEVVKREAAGWVRLKINRCETTNGEDWHWTIPELKTGAIIRRAADTIGKGRAVRLRWTDEAARDAVMGVRLKTLGKFV